MRGRTLVLMTLILTLIATSACVNSRVSQMPVTTPVPTKTLRPTFTPTQVKPTLTPSPTAALPTPIVEAPAPQPTPVPPTPEPPTPAPTPAPPPQASFTVTTATLNVRSGPGTNYNVIGQIRQGQTFPITGKNPAGNWWQFDYNGRPGWVSGQLVRVTNAELVQVATNIPAAPTARPQPTAPPRPPAQPTQPPAPARQFAQGGTEYRNSDNPHPWITFWGRLGRPTDANPISGFQLRVTTAAGSKTEPFGPFWENAYAGITGSEFKYNVKIELPRSGGGFTAVVVDGNGAEVSDPISGTLIDRTQDVIMTWVRR